MSQKKYTVYINNLNYLQSPFIADAARPLEITEEEFLKTQEFTTGSAWCWNEELQTFEQVTTPNLTALRLARNLECFNLINRSPLWLDSLTEEQRNELKTWYQNWLDVTETLQIPTKPTWLK